MNFIKGVIAFVGAMMISGQSCVAAEGVASMRSVHSFTATVERVETAAREKGFQLFGSLDHAAAAASVGQAMPPSTVLVIGNPRIGTERFIRFPTLAIDLPLKILVWQDATGVVSVTYNTASHMLSLAQRHGLQSSDQAKEQAVRTEVLMATIAEAATR